MNTYRHKVGSTNEAFTPESTILVCVWMSLSIWSQEEKRCDLSMISCCRGLCLAVRKDTPEPFVLLGHLAIRRRRNQERLRREVVTRTNHQKRVRRRWKWVEIRVPSASLVHRTSTGRATIVLTTYPGRRRGSWRLRYAIERLRMMQSEMQGEKTK